MFQAKGYAIVRIKWSNNFLHALEYLQIEQMKYLGGIISTDFHTSSLTKVLSPPFSLYKMFFELAASSV